MPLQKVPPGYNALCKCASDFVQSRQKQNNHKHLLSGLTYLPAAALLCFVQVQSCDKAAKLAPTWTPACPFTATFMHCFGSACLCSSYASLCWRNPKKQRGGFGTRQGTGRELGCGGSCLGNSSIHPHHDLIILRIIFLSLLSFMC